MRLGVYLAEQKPCYVKYLLQLLGPLQFHMAQFIAIVFLKDLKESVKKKSLVKISGKVYNLMVAVDRRKSSFDLYI